jgi:hypothetical protein
MNPGLDEIQGYGPSTQPEATMHQILGTTRCNENQDAPLLIHIESSYEIFIHDTNGYESIVPMRNDVGTLQHFLYW